MTTTEGRAGAGVTIGLGKAWFDLPIDAEPRTEDLEARVDARIRRDPELADRRDALVKMLRFFAADAHGRGAVGAGLLWELHEYDVVATATLYAVVSRRPHGPVSAEMERLRALLTARYAGDRTEPAVEVRDLPVGRSVRVQVISETAQLRPDEAETVALLETVQYWIPLADRPTTLLLTFSTPNLAGIDRMAAEFDLIAEHVKLRPPRHP